MSARKQQLLRRHRKHKRIALLVALVALLLLGALVAWWLVPLLLVLGWIALRGLVCRPPVLQPSGRLRLCIPGRCPALSGAIDGGRITPPERFEAADTLILEIELKASWLGRWLDPQVWVGEDRQDFERALPAGAISTCPASMSR